MGCERARLSAWNLAFAQRVAHHELRRVGEWFTWVGAASRARARGQAVAWNTCSRCDAEILMWPRHRSGTWNLVENLVGNLGGNLARNLDTGNLARNLVGNLAWNLAGNLESARL